MVIGATRTTLSTVGVRPEVLWWHKPGCGIVDGGCAVHRGGFPTHPTTNAVCHVGRIAVIGRGGST
jgi:hypothetical protein